MNSNIQIRMLGAAYSCMLPLAKLLLRAGITYRQFDAIAKRAFVREAMQESDLRGRAINMSRVAVKTGLSRKDVKRIRDSLRVEGVSAGNASVDPAGPLAKVLHTWHTDRRFLGRDGSPRDLDFQDEESGFAALVRAVAGDVPPGAVRAELKRSGAIVDLEDGRLRAIKRFYVPGSVDEKAITVLSGMVFPLSAGIVHNTDPTRITDGFIQRFAFSDHLSAGAIPEFRAWSRERATKFVESMDDWLAQHEIQEPVEARGSSQMTNVGIGVFYYEGLSAEDALRRLPPQEE